MHVGQRQRPWLSENFLSPRPPFIPQNARLSSLVQTLWSLCSPSREVVDLTVSFIMEIVGLELQPRKKQTFSLQCH